MLISKFDLYKSEWLELVFDDRNKEYGAYNLRQHYAGNMTRAMGITFLGVAVLFAASMAFKPKPKAIDNNGLVITLTQPTVPAEPKKSIIPPAPKAEKQNAPAKPVTTIKDPPPLVVSDNKAEKMADNESLKKAAIGTENITGDPIEGNEPPETKARGEAAPPTDETVYSTTSGLDVMPSPVGGDAAWIKFLSKNLRFPPSAQEEGVSGKVFLTFIIEKDGRLTDISVIRQAGHGFDEEALRVLKMAKAWKPGIQNGRPVRVKYTIPINFQISE